MTAAQKALQTIARDVRSARSLSKVESESDLTLQLPEFETNGQIKLPITDGKTVRFHLKKGDLIREEKGSNPETLVRDLEPNGSFVITPSFVDENKDGANQPNELRSANIHLVVVRRAQHPGLDREYDSSITVYLQNSKSVLGKSGETTIYTGNTGAGGAESKPPKKKKSKGDSGTPDDPHPPNPGEEGE